MSLSKLTIVKKLLLFFIISSSLSLVAFFATLYNTVKPKVAQQSHLEIDYRSQKIVLNLQERINNAQTLAISLARMGESLSKNSQQDKETLYRFLQQSKKNYNIAGGGVWPEPYAYAKDKKLASFFWARNGEHSYVFVDDYNKDNGKDYHNENWYKPLKNLPKDEVFWSEPYKDPHTNVAMITVSVGMYEGSNFIGISTIDVALTGLEELLSTQTAHFHGYVVLFDSYKNVITSQGVKAIDIRKNIDMYRLDSQDDIISDIKYDIFLKEGAKKSIFNLDKINWKLMVVMPDKYVYKNIFDVVSNLLTIIGVLVFLMILFSFFILKKILIKPLEQISDELIEINDKKNSREYLSIISNDELGALAKSFNKHAELSYFALRTKSDFLANMSHEIRTPMNAILGFIEILSNSEKDETKKEQFGLVTESGKTLLSIINDILDFSKIESGKLHIENEAFVTRELFEQVVDFYQEKCNEKSIKMSMKIDELLPLYAKGDTVRIKQVVTNLISNAIKFTQEGEIKINLSFVDKSLHFSIEDSGVGMREEFLEKIFSPFEQEDASTTRKFGGTGLGLSISSNLIQIMNGKISVESELEEGTTFKFQLPLFEEEVIYEAVEVETQEDDELQFVGKVLVVEDNRANQMLLKLLLLDRGLVCDIADDGLIALEMCKDKKYDIILMDENMPNMNGIEATKALKEDANSKSFNSPIVAVTANALKDDKKRFLEAGMQEYISKPIETKELDRVLSKFLKQL